MIDVACAIIFSGDKILAAQRGPGMRMPFKWEFPGGKVEPGETPEQCIVREIKEELGIVIKPLKRLASCLYDYGEFQIKLLPMTAVIEMGEIQLIEHHMYVWLTRENLDTLEWASADKLVVKELKVNKHL